MLRNFFALFLSVFLFLNTCLAQVGPASVSQIAGPPPKPPVNSNVMRGIDSLNCDLNNEIIRSLLRQADELFISHKDSIAAVRYQEAMERIGYLNVFFSCYSPDYVKLLNSNIRYRLMLINNQYDFWGITYNTLPVNPVQHWSKFKELKKKFDDAAKELHNMVLEIDKKDNVIDEVHSKEQIQMTEQTINQLQGTQIDVKLSSYEENIGRLNDRITWLNQKQIENEQKSTQLLGEIKQLSASLQNVALNALSKAAGLPVNLGDLNLKDGLKSAVLKLGQDYILKDNTLMEKFGELKKTVDKVLDVYMYVDSLKDKVKCYTEYANQIYQSVHQKSFKGLEELGMKLLAKADGPLKTAIAGFATNAKNLQGLFYVSENNKQLVSSIYTTIRSKASAVQNFKAYLASDARSITEWAKSICVTVENIPEKLKAKSLEILVSGYPEIFLNNLTTSVRDELKKAAGVANLAELKKWLKTAQLDVDNGLCFLRNNKLVLPKLNIDFSLENFIRQLQYNVLEYSDIGKEKLSNLIDLISGSATEVINQVIDRPYILNTLKNALIGTVNSEAELTTMSNKFFDDVVNDFKSRSQGWQGVLDRISALDIASSFLNDYASKQLPEGAYNIVKGGLSDGQSMAGMVLNAGLAYACPYVAIAAQLIQTFFARKKKLNEFDKIQDEQKSIAIEKLHYYDLLGELIVNKRLAELDKDINAERLKLSRELFYSYRQQLFSLSNSVTLSRIKINAKKSLLYYLSERLRMEYYVITKGLLFRYQQNLYDKVYSNPDNYRYMIDEDIRLTEWLDKDVSATRNDLDGLVDYWNKVEQLILDNCQECNSQYLPSGTAMETRSISLKENYPETWSRFQDAIRKKQKDFTFLLPILPGNQDYIGDDKINVRFLNFEVGGIDMQSRFLPLTSSTLWHPGVAYIESLNGFNKEVFKPASITGITAGKEPRDALCTKWPEPFDLNNLKKRLSQMGEADYDPIEGYGMYTIWELKIPIDKDINNLTDIRVRFAYSFSNQFEHRSLMEDTIKFKSGASVLNINSFNLRAIGKGQKDKVLKDILNDKSILIEGEILSIQN